MLDLYYAIWATLFKLPLLVRAAIVLAVCVTLLWIVFRPFVAFLLSLLLRLLNLVLQGSVLLIDKVLFLVIGSTAPVRYVSFYNRVVSIFAKISGHFSCWAQRLAKKAPIPVGPMAASYFILLFLVALPSLLTPIVSERYLPYFSIAADLYQRLEAPSLKAAAAYEPFFDVSFSASNSSSARTRLSLSEQGRSGANVRDRPSMQGTVLQVVSGDLELLYLGDQKDGWIHVQLPDRSEGWIYGDLLTEIP